MESQWSIQTMTCKHGSRFEVAGLHTLLRLEVQKEELSSDSMCMESSTNWIVVVPHTPAFSGLVTGS